MSILLLYLAACKKKEEILPENKTQNSTNNIQNARAYFYAKQAQALAMRQQNSSSSKTNGTIFESTEFNSFAPAWDSTQTFTAQNGNTVLLSPVFRNITISYQANIYYIRRLRTELNPQGIVLKSTIIELITKQAAIAEQKYAILTEPQNYPNTSEYTIYEYDLAYNLTNERCVNCEENEQSGPPPLLPIDMCRYETDICGVILISYEPCEPNRPKQAIEPCGSTGGTGGSNGGGGSGTLPTNPPPNNNPAPQNPAMLGDWGQDEFPKFGTIEYKGVLIDTKYWIGGNPLPKMIDVDANIIEVVKSIVDDEDFRDLISDYLGEGKPKLRITFTGDDKNSGTFYKYKGDYYIHINPNLKNGLIGLVDTLCHEGAHADYTIIDDEEEVELLEAETWLGNKPKNINLIEHNAMSVYKTAQAIKILKSFDKGPLGRNAGVNDNYYKGLFLFGLLKGPDPEIPDPSNYPYVQLDIKFWYSLSKEERYEYQLFAYNLVQSYLNP